MDPAHDWTDKQIEALQRKFGHVYSEAARGMREKLGKHLEAYEKGNAEWQKMLASGQAKQSEYEAWLEQVTMDGRFMEGLASSLAADATNANQKALDMVNDRIPRVYAENANYGAYQVEKGLSWDTHSFDLYDESTVRRLMATTEHDQLIHEVIPVGPTRPDLQSLRVDLDAAKDVRWNRQKFTSAITQSILQGESVPNAAKRLMGVLNMDRAMATRAARTAMTGAENAGRVDSYKRAKAMGIDLEQEWMATLDERTRHSHRQLDGQHVPVGEKFEVEGHEIEFPGDPKAHPSETYNCRCTLVAWFPGIEKEDPERWSRLPNGMTYEEWKGAKESDEKRRHDKAAKVPSKEPSLANVAGVKPKPWDDEPEYYYIPQQTRERLDAIESLESYSDFERYFKDNGIKLTTDLDILKGERRDDSIDVVKEQCQKIAVAIDAYKETFGPEALSKLKRINLYDSELPNEAAYHFNVIGEDDPLAGTIRFRQWGASGRTIFHELAHAFQDSQAEPWEDAVTYAKRMTEQAHLAKDFTAYAGASADVYEAERFADAFGYGFASGRKEGIDFIKSVWRELRNG